MNLLVWAIIGVLVKWQTNQHTRSVIFQIEDNTMAQRQQSLHHQHTRRLTKASTRVRFVRILSNQTTPCVWGGVGRVLKVDCSDITNTLVGISGETAPNGGNLRIYWVHSGAICWAVVLNHSWCVTPHSSPTRGWCWPCWPLQPILNILNIFAIYIYIYIYILDRE